MENSIIHDTNASDSSKKNDTNASVEDTRSSERDDRWSSSSSVAVDNYYDNYGTQDSCLTLESLWARVANECARGRINIILYKLPKAR